MIDKFSSVKQAKYYRDSSIIKPTDTDLGQVYKKSQSGTRLGTIKDSKLTQALSRKNRQNHTHILGSTGTGKSKIIELLIRQDIQDKKCGSIEPHHPDCFLIRDQKHSMHINNKKRSFIELKE